MQLDWQDPVYAIAGPLVVFGLAIVTARRRPHGGWFWSERQTRIMGSAVPALTLGPLTAGLMGAMHGWASGTEMWSGAVGPFLISCAISLAGGAVSVLGGRGPGPVPPAVRRFLQAWGDQGLGEQPQVQVMRTPPVVRLIFPDSTHLGPRSRSALLQLEQELAGSYSLSVWSGDRQVFPE